MARRRHRIGMSCILLSSAIGGLAAVAVAGPPAPTVLFPAGGGRGQTVTVTAAGKFDAWPVQTWTHEPGLNIEANETKGAFTVKIADDAPAGLRWIRLYDESGASSLLPFEVGTLPGFVESEPNDAPAQAGQVDPFPAVVDGRLAKSGDVDNYAITLKKGQTLVASLAGQRLGSPMDAVLQVVSTAGFVLQQNDDEVGLDPQLEYEAPADGVYLVRCFAFPAEPNSTIGFAGGEKYVYRLTLTTGGFLDHTLPLAVQSQGDAEVRPFGTNLPADISTLSAEPTASTDRVRVWHKELAGRAALPVVPYPSLGTTDQAASETGQTITPPVSVSGTISQPEDRHTYRFAAHKGDSWQFQLLAGGLGSPLNPVLQITDPAGKIAFEKDATGKGGRDLDHRLTVPTDGEYTVSIRDLAERGGPRQFYRLDIAAPQPDFRLTLASDRITVSPGKPATVEATVIRENGFAEPIEITLDGLPEGIDAAPVRDELKDDAKPEDGVVRSTVKLTLTAGEETKAWSGPLRLIGRTTGDAAESKERSATVEVSIAGTTTTSLWLTVAAAAK